MTCDEILADFLLHQYLFTVFRNDSSSFVHPVSISLGIVVRNTVIPCIVVKTNDYKNSTNIMLNKLMYGQTYGTSCHTIRHI